MREPPVEQHADLDKHGDDEKINPEAPALLALPPVRLVPPQMPMVGQIHFDFSRRCLGTGRGSAHFGGFTGAIARQLSHGYFFAAM